MMPERQGGGKNGVVGRAGTKRGGRGRHVDAHEEPLRGLTGICAGLPP